MQKDNDFWFKTMKEKKIIEETPPGQMRKKELKHEVERAEDANLMNGLYESKIKKDATRVNKLEEQMVFMRRGVTLFGVLLLITIVFFVLSVMILNSKVSTLRNEVQFLQSQVNDLRNQQKS